MSKNSKSRVEEIKAKLCQDIRKYIADNELSNSKAAEVFGIQRKRVVEIQQGRIDRGFTIDYLVTMLDRVGIRTLDHNVA